MRSAHRIRRSISRRRAALGALLAAMLVSPLVTACAGTSDDPAEQPTLTYWATYQTAKPELTEKVMRAELDEFTRETGIAVELDLISWGTLYSRILGAVSSGTGPDLVNIGTSWAAPLQATGAFLPFDSATMGKIGGADRFLPAALGATGMPGQAPMSVPLLRSAYGLFYNTAMFERAGITEPPATWDELVDTAQRLTGPGRFGLAVAGAASSANAHLAFILARQHGVNLVDESGASNLSDPAVVAAISRYVELMSVHQVVDPSAAEWSGDEDDAALMGGRAAMLIGQAGVRAYLDESGFTDYAVAPVPTVRAAVPGDDTVRSIVAGTNVAVFANTPHPDHALQLVRFLTADDTQTALNTAFTSLPVTSGAYQDSAFTDPVSQVFAGVMAESSEPMPQTPRWGTIETVLGTTVSALWEQAATGTLTDVDIAEALEAADRQILAGD